MTVLDLSHYPAAKKHTNLRCAVTPVNYRPSALTAAGLGSMNSASANPDTEFYRIGRFTLVVPPAVRHFAANSGLSAYLPAAAEIGGRALPTVRQCVCSVREDAGGQVVAVSAVFAGDPLQGLQQYEEFMDEWRRSVPESTGRLLVLDLRYSQVQGPGDRKPWWLEIAEAAVSIPPEDRARLSVDASLQIDRDLYG